MRRPSQPADSLEDPIRNSAHGVSPRRRMLDTSGKEGAKFLASDASPATRVRPHIDWSACLLKISPNPSHQES